MNPAHLNGCCRVENAQKLGSFRRKSDGRTLKRYRCKTWLCCKISNLKNFA